VQFTFFLENAADQNKKTNQQKKFEPFDSKSNHFVETYQWIATPPARNSKIKQVAMIPMITPLPVNAKFSWFHDL
jgi:hypothetical protein